MMEHDQDVFAMFCGRNSLSIGIAEDEIACRSGASTNSSFAHDQGELEQS
eukprot:CAMPEP_0179343312 /NCGR_PEP_ID=MMETSP0797-20121207/70899_1 /TAXON_ID=47934 /ORGANISM="Dinophysis acuminata, Strain DAEP01" /LENGTH=49 /DNA_ID= /DNA_START= /DNA_END= /DNA_ORIENTATION=